MTKIDEWNERYRAREELTFDPSPLVMDAVADVAPGRALDLACGAGRNALWLAERGWKVVALDGAEEAIRIVRDHDPSIDARVVDLEADAPLPFPDASFDLVLILFFLHRPLFAEARRVLRPGGLLVSSVRMGGISPAYTVREGELRELVGMEVVREQEDGQLAEIIAVKRES